MVEIFTVLFGYLWTVYFEASSLKLATTVAVLAEDIISVDAPKEMLTNAPFPTQGYSFLIKFGYVDHFCAQGQFHFTFILDLVSYVCIYYNLLVIRGLVPIICIIYVFHIVWRYIGRRLIVILLCFLILNDILLIIFCLLFLRKQ